MPTYQQGQYYNEFGGVANYNPWTGSQLAPGETFMSPNTVTGPTTPPTGTQPTYSPNQNTTSTTTISNANIMNQIPGMVNQLNNLSNTGLSTNSQGNVQYADGSLYQPQEFIDVDTTEEDKQYNDLLESMKTSLDAQTKSLIDNIQQKYALRREEQKEINRRQKKGYETALLMGGVTGQGSTAQYAPISSGGIVAEQEKYGLKQIADIDAEERDLIAQARAAQESGNFKIMEKKLAMAEEKRAAKIQAAAELNKKIAEQNAKMREQSIQSATDFSIADLYSKGVTDPTEIMKQLRSAGLNVTSKQVSDSIKNIVPPGLDDLVKTLSTNGAPADVIQKVLTSGNLSDAYRAAGGYASGGSGIVGEYNFYRAQAQAAGQVPVDFQTYQNIDANRKARATGADRTDIGTITKGLLTPEQQNDPFIKKLLATTGGKAMADSSIQKLDKGLVVLSQLGTLQDNIADVKTGPIIGKFKGANPWDTNAQTIKAQLNAVVPNLARGVYGEVGVLTDNDIKTYAKTLPNLTSTEDVRNAVLYITLDMIGKSIKTTLNTNASAGRDVSGFVDVYTEMENTKNSILSGIPGAKVPDSIKYQGANEVVQSETQAKNKILQYGKGKPSFQKVITSKINMVNPFTGQKFTYMDLLQIYPEAN